MSFLTLCVDLRREGGMSGTGPTAVTGQTGEMLRIVEWINAAYKFVQNLHPNWDFLRNEFSFNTIAATASYAKADVPLTELGSYKIDSLRCYLTAIGVADEQELEYVPWTEFRTVYLRSTSSTLAGRPKLVTVKPDQSLMFWPIPDDIYTVTGEYYKRAQEMAANADEPLIPFAFQDAILWKALMLYGAYAGSNDAYSHGQNEYRAVLAKLVLNQLPKVGYGAPLV